MSTLDVLRQRGHDFTMVCLYSSADLTVIRCFKHFVNFRELFGKDERQFGHTTIDKNLTMI